MSFIVTIAASSGYSPGGAAVLSYAQRTLRRFGARVDAVVLPEPRVLGLKWCRSGIAAELRNERALLARADGVMIAAPGSSEGYACILEEFLGLFPAATLLGERVLPLVAGGRRSHLSLLEAVLSPALGSLGPCNLLPGVQIPDAHVFLGHGGSLILDEVAEDQLLQSLATLATASPMSAWSGHASDRNTVPLSSASAQGRIAC